MVIKKLTKKVESAAKSFTTTGSSKLGSRDLTALIAKKAYEYYQKRGYTHGNDQSDWYRAEKEVKAGLKK